jgi:hypothetical protein
MRVAYGIVILTLLMNLIYCGCSNGSKGKDFSSPGGYYTLRIPRTFKTESVPLASQPDDQVKFIEQTIFRDPADEYQMKIVVTENAHQVDPVKYSKVMMYLWDIQGTKIIEQQNVTINGEVWITFIVREQDGKWNFNANLVKPAHVIVVGWTTSKRSEHKKASPRFRKILQTIRIS